MITKYLLVSLTPKLGLAASGSSGQLEIYSCSDHHVERIGKPVIVLTVIVRVIDGSPGVAHIGVDVKLQRIEHQAETNAATYSIVKTTVRVLE